MNYNFDWMMNDGMGFSGFMPFVKVIGIPFIGLIGILFLAFWIWMIVDCVKRNFKNSNEKIIWILVILFAKIIGAGIYFFIVKNKDKK